MLHNSGIITLIGAGPGDPDLITVAGLNVLKKAEIVFYDALIGEELLKNCSKKCQKIFVGKRAGKHSYAQTEINQQLFLAAKKFKRIVRLKGGDPFVFGRGYEEIQFLAKRGVQTKIIPGVTSAFAVPTLAGIPVTHREVASGVTVITGHPTKGGRLSLQKYTKAETLIILMGLTNLAQIGQKLIKSGRGKSTPVAVIANGSLPTQIVVTGTLEDIAKKAQEAKLKPPAVIVIGKVVNLLSK